jgi:hypothetical protein
MSITVKVARDEELEAELLDAFNSWSGDRPRNAQRTLGPSSLGDCRELIRATIAGDEGIPERPRGLDGAAIGTIVGDALEGIFEARMGVQTQVPVTIHYDRAGVDKKFVAFSIPWEDVLGYIDIAEERLTQVFDVLDAGSPEESRWGLRDQEPGTCFYFQCPFRLNCWGGADNWVPSGTITTADGTNAVAEYIRARKDEKDAIAYKREARENLRGIQGVTHEKIDGLNWAVSWKPGRNDDRLDVIPM